MSVLTSDHKVRPPQASHDEFVSLLGRLKSVTEPTATLTGPDGEQIVLPPEVFETLRDVVKMMAEGQAIMLAPVNLRLTTQEAADLLGISRQSFIKVLDAGEVAFKKIGRHRRVRLDDLLEYKTRRSRQRREALDRMVEIAHKSGMYESTATPEHTT